MAAPASSPITTPKRKRGVDTLIPPIQFSFSPNQTTEDGSNSPRSKVAHRFRGLDITSGGGVAADDEVANSDSETRGKRQRPDAEMKDAAETQPEAKEETQPDTVPEAVGLADSDGKTVPQPQVTEDSAKSGLKLPEGSIQRAYPSINRLSETKSKVTKKKRSGTPPPRRRKKAFEEDEDDEMEIVEPIRAALTWREDEITIYDPEDPDDDGTGINGVGFKPTHALAQARITKRRQQMAEYRKREASDARAKRSQRRREEEQTPSSSADNANQKVRFMEDRNVSYGPIPTS